MDTPPRAAPLPGDAFHRTAPPLFGEPPVRALQPAPFLPTTRGELDALGWDACDVVLVTGDAYVDHPSFGMAIIGRLLEAHGFRVGILPQPPWRSVEAFRELGRPRLCWGVTAGNMDSLVNHYTSDRKPRRNDAYSPDGVGGLRPDRATIVYTQRCREAYKGVPVILGGIEASLRRIAHYDYWSDEVRRSILLDTKADLLLYGNAERALVAVVRALHAGAALADLTTIRGTAQVRRGVPSGVWTIDSTEVDTPGEVEPPPDPYADTTRGAAPPATTEPAEPAATTEPAATAASPPAPLVQLRRDRPRSATTPAQPDGMDNAPEASGAGGLSPVRPPVTAAAPPPRRAPPREVPREQVAVRLPAYEAVRGDPVLYAHASRVLHRESNPHNARALVQAHGDRDVWIAPPPIPLTTAEMDAVFELPYRRVPHPRYGTAKIPAYEMIRFSVTITRGCFGGCSFCSITEHEGRIIQNRSEGSVLREIGAIRDTTPGFTGTISDLGGPTANMWRLACRSRTIEASCRRPSCVYPGICENLVTDHAPLIQLYRKARAVPGVKKVLIASGLRYDLAVESPEYVEELATHHVGGLLKIAPEHTERGPLDKMMKPGIGTYDRFKAMFERASARAGKRQHLIPYFIAAHPGTSDEDMLQLALWLKANGFKADQVQAFLPSPMASATTMYHTERNPLRPLTRAGPGSDERVETPKSPRQRRLHKAFLRWHDPDNWPLLRDALRRMGREDLIGQAPGCLIPRHQPPGHSGAAEGERAGAGAGGGAGVVPRKAAVAAAKLDPERVHRRLRSRTGASAPSRPFHTQHTGLPPAPRDDEPAPAANRRRKPATRRRP